MRHSAWDEVSADGYDEGLCDTLPGMRCPLMGTTIHTTGILATFVIKADVVCAFDGSCHHTIALFLSHM